MQNILKFIMRSFFIFAWMGLIYFFLMLPKFFVQHEDQQKTLRVFTWANRIDENMIRQFEKETGIKIYLNYYESSEELLTKIEKTSTLDCDVMIPSGYLIEKMIQKDLVKKIDKTQCPFIKNIFPEFLHIYFDPENDYSIPIFWDVFGIGYNAQTVGDKPVTTKMLFDQQSMVGTQVGMTDDPQESIFLGAQYLGIPLRGSFNEQELHQINELLQKQKEYVGAYSDTQQGYFLSSNTFAVVASDREIVARQMLQHDHIKFATLSEGSMLRLDNVVIHAETKKDELIYKFLQFLYNYDVMMHHAKKYCILPTMKNVFQNLDKKYIGVPDLYPGSATFKKLVLFKLGMTQKELNNFWIGFKAA
jgi:spermidine/putrescine transport system substrate-binding protein